MDAVTWTSVVLRMAERSSKDIFIDVMKFAYKNYSYGMIIAFDFMFVMILLCLFQWSVETLLFGFLIANLMRAGVIYVTTSCKGFEMDQHPGRNAALTILQALAPSLFLASLIIHEFLQPGVGLPVLGNKSMKEGQRICFYVEKNQSLKSFYTHLGWENHTTVYPYYGISCHAESLLGGIFAEFFTSFFPALMKFGLTFVFMKFVCSLKKQFEEVYRNRGDDDDFRKQMDDFLKLTMLDFFDLMDFLLIGFNPKNFVYLASNGLWSKLFPYYALVANFIVTVELFLAYDVFHLLRHEYQMQARVCAIASMCIDVPLGIFRIVFAMNGLYFSNILLAKNVALMILELSVIHSGTTRSDGNNPIYKYVSDSVFHFLPQAKAVKRALYYVDPEEPAEKAEKTVEKLEKAEKTVEELWGKAGNRLIGFMPSISGSSRRPFHCEQQCPLLDAPERSLESSAKT